MTNFGPQWCRQVQDPVGDLKAIMSDSNVVRWSKSHVTEAKRGSLTFMASMIVSEWLGGGTIEGHPMCKAYVVTLVVVVYQDFTLTNNEVLRSMIWAETCARGGKFQSIDEDPEALLTEEFWASEVNEYVEYFTGKLSKHNFEFIEPRTDPVEDVVRSLKILMNRQTKVDPKLH